MANNRLVVQDNETLNRILSNRPLLTSEPLGWQGLNLEYRYSPAGSTPELCIPYHLITFICDAPKTPQVVRRFEGKQWHDEARIGESVIIPKDHTYGVEWDTPGSYLILAIDPDDFATTINEAQDPDQIQLTPQFSQPDPLLYQLSLGLKGLIESGAQGNRLYAETLTHTLMVHMIQHYTTCSKELKTYSDGLSKAKLRLVIDYIQDNLEQDLGLKELAALLQLSPHYFAHLFKRSVGLAPHQYVIKQRIKQAKKLLKNREISIADIAYQVGFSSQAHLNRHFKRLVGTTPGRYRRG